MHPGFQTIHNGATMHKMLIMLLVLNIARIPLIPDKLCAQPCALCAQVMTSAPAAVKCKYAERRLVQDKTGQATIFEE